MADRVSTLRLKVVGMDDAATEVDSFSRKYGASMAKIDQINRTIGERMAGDLDTSKWDAALKGVQERASKIAERAGITDPMKGFEFKEQDVKEDLANNLKRFAGNQEAIESSERAFNAEMADIAAQRTAYLAKPEEEALKIREKSAADASKLQLKLNAADLKAKEQANKEAWASQAKWEKATFQAKQDADAKLLKEQEKSAADTLKVKEKAEMDGAKLQLRLQKDEYNAKVKADAAILKAQEKADADLVKEFARANADRRREARAQEKEDKASGGGFNGFGGKMMLGMAAGRAVGDVLGDQHGGREIGSAISGFMFGGPIVGAVVTGLDLISEGFIANRENTIAADKSAKEFSHTLEELSDQWSGLANNLARGDVFNEAMRRMEKGGGAMAEKSQSSLDTQGSKGTMGFLAESMGQVMGGFIERNSFGLVKPGEMTGTPASQSERDAAVKEEKAALASRKDALQFEKEETPRIAADRERIYEAEKKLAQARTESAGKTKDDAVLHAEINLSNEKLTSEKRQQMALADAAVSRSSKLVEDAKKAGDLGARAHAEQDRDEAIQARQELQDQWQEKFRDKQLEDSTKLAEHKGRLNERIQEASDKYIGVVGGGQTGGRFFDFKGLDLNKHAEAVAKYASGISLNRGGYAGGNGSGRFLDFSPRDHAAASSAHSDATHRTKYGQMAFEANQRAKESGKHASEAAKAASGKHQPYQQTRTELGDAFLGPDGMYHVKAHGMSATLTPEQYANLRAAEKSGKGSVRDSGSNKSSYGREQDERNLHGGGWSSVDEWKKQQAAKPQKLDSISQRAQDHALDNLIKGSALTIQSTKTPADIVQENILKVLQEIAAQKMS